MPWYEYECEQCGSFEVQQRMSDDPLTRHECGAKAARRISRTAFTLKGSGWYSDGYASSGGQSCSPGGCAKPGCAAKAKPADA